MPDPVTFGAAVGWGMTAAGWVLSPVISRLVGKGFSYLGVDKPEKLEKLKLKVIQLELLLEVEEDVITNHMDRLDPLLKSLKSAFYESEEIMDEIEYHRLEKQVMSLPCKRNWKHNVQSAMPKISCLKKQESGNMSDEAPPAISNKKLKKCLEKIETIVNEAHIILELLKLPSVDERQTVAANSRSAVTTSAPPSVVIGRDKDRDEIIAMLHEKVGDGQPNADSVLPYSVIGIHGVPGSGKSTLAQIVCDSEKKDREDKIDGHFDHIMWVHVSQNFSVDAIFREMLESATGNPCRQFSNRNNLQQKLEETLKRKKFLLVMDDVWYKRKNGASQQEELKKIVSPLKVGEAGSKILVTSRTADALLALGAVRCIPTSDLDDSAFLKLFMHYALEGATINGDRRIFEAIGSAIAKKLRSSPLAARTVGGQLRMRPNVEFWKDTRDRDSFNETMGALRWSYQHLDEQVRRCFAYCSIFPRRHELKRDELISLWVAEGFIRSTDAGEEMEAVGRRYFDELVSTSFLQRQPKRDSAIFEYFTFHELLHDLAQKVAGNDCFTIEDGWTGVLPRDVRHLFIQTYDKTMITERILEMGNLRTLIIRVAKMDMLIEEEEFGSMLMRLRKLRVLSILVNCADKFSFPASIGQLKHLRYLAFRTDYSVVQVIPRTFTKLYHMQVLDLEFPSCEDMSNLINLRHVYADMDFPNIGRLTLLQTLRFFVVKKKLGHELQQLAHLSKLRGSLHIIGLENVENKEEAVEANLAGKERLQELVLTWKWDDESCSPDLQAEVFEGLCPPKDLERLNIRGYRGSRYPSWLVGEQNGPKYLQELELFRCSRLGSIPEHSELFAHLRFLRIDSCSWDSLPDNMEGLVSLQKLKINDCPEIKLLPTLPESLEEFILERCSGVLVWSCQTIGDPNWQKIEHIPSKIFKPSVQDFPNWSLDEVQSSSDGTCFDLGFPSDDDATPSSGLLRLDSRQRRLIVPRRRLVVPRLRLGSRRHRLHSSGRRRLFVPWLCCC